MRAITILLIEDNPPEVRLIREMLKEVSNFKYNLISEVTLKEGCEQIQKNNFDIILLDLNLPDSTGKQTFQKVIECSNDIPVVLITGMEEEKLSLKLIMEGAQDYITKQSMNPDLLGKSILYSIERQKLLKNIKKQNVQIDRIEKERILIAKFPSQNPDPILRVALNGKLLYINEAGIKLLPDWQLLKNEIIPSRMKDIIDPIFNEGTNIKFELAHREFIYSFYAVPLFEEGYINLYGRDITERKQAEDALRESEEKHRTILQTAMDGFWLSDMQGHLLEVNEAYCRMSGYSTQELLSMRITDIEAAETADYTAAHIQKIKSKSEDRFESRHRRKDGSIFDVEVSVQYQFFEDGRFVVFIQDISERKRAEQELILAKEHAEESDNLKTSFLNNISHEIRTPFNGILGFLSIIQDNDLTVNERDEYIGIINKSAYRLMNTINDIVEVSQIQAGQIKLTASQTNIRGLSDELFNRYKTDAETHGLEFNLNYGLPRNIENIFTDTIKLKTVLSILIGNAIKFTKSGSIDFGIKLVDAGIEFSVKDTGVGILKNKQQVIFERFRQVDGSNTRHFEGSGLGLSIVKAYVEILHGKIWVESDPEDEYVAKGSVFRFIIPYLNLHQEKSGSKIVVADEVSMKEIKDLKMLIVEDDKGSALLLEMVLKNFGKQVIKVTTGFEAVEACRNNPDIDLILMDIKMPGMDGYEATRQIRQYNTEVVIIAQTAYALASDKEKAMEAGCNDYTAKPIKKDQLLRLLQKYFLKQIIYT